jgi:tetratricopeptide (TPR) repeat protein
VAEKKPPDPEEILRNYRDIPDEDRKRAQVFFDRGKTVAGTGNYEYAIEMYIQGLSVDPENVEAHQILRDISLKRKASGGKDMGMMDRMRIPKAKEDKQGMLNAEKLLAYDPGNIDRMLAMFQSAYKAGFYDTVLWIGPILQRANADARKPDFSKFVALRDVYNALEEYKLATDACHFALTVKPEDMNLQHELKNLAAKQTMKGGKYGSAKSFRESVRDRELQDKLMVEDKDVHEVDALIRAIHEAEAQWQADPEDQSKLSRLIEALRRPEQIDYENRAIELLEEAFQKTRVFKWRQRVGEIRIAQLNRQDRALRAEAEEHKNDPDAADYVQRLREFQAEKAKTELEEYQLILEHYPTDSNARFQMAARMFQLGQFQEAVPVLQHVRGDPKYRVAASVLLGQAFLSMGFVDEAVDTLKQVIDDYPGRGDEKSMQMFYWYARALEEKKDNAAAIKAYSQLAQWNFNFRDVQTRIKRLRSGDAEAPAPDTMNPRP